jgi:phosphate transport system permease protein
MSLYASRRRSNLTAMTLCLLATTIGILWLLLILFSLLMNGLPHLSLEVFTEMTPPPGETGGGLLNSIFGTLMMTVLGVGIGAPIGILAGTYLAEYGRY